MATHRSNHLPDPILVRNAGAVERDSRGPPGQAAGCGRRNHARFRLYLLALAAVLLSGAAVDCLVAARFVSPLPVPTVASQGLTPPGPVEDLRNGPRAVQPVAVPNDLAQYLQDISVTIRAAGGEGSGVLKRTEDGTTWVWTAGHVVAGLRKTRQVIDSKTGATKTLVEFDDAKVVKLLIENGRTVGRIEVDAEVVRYSDANYGEDLALLRIRKKNFSDASVRFYRGETLPLRGTELYHCGSLLGEFGANSLTQGILSQHGRLIDGRVYDQVSTPSFPGSSGGGVYLKSDGRLIGLLVRGAPGGFSLIVPMRRLEAWAKKAQVEWAIRDEVPVPSQGEVEKLPIEEESPGR